MKYIKNGIIALLIIFCIGACDDVSRFLDQYTENGPIIYAAKVNYIYFNSGFYRVRANIFPLEDVNKDRCILSWEVTKDKRDSLIIKYTAENYDENLECYYGIINFAVDSLAGNIQISAQNVDIYGNRSLITEKGAFIYDKRYRAGLINDEITFSSPPDYALINQKISSIGNFISYQKSDDSFSGEIFITNDSLLLTNAKIGGILKNKTAHKIDSLDLDTLIVINYSESVITE